jgi:PAS domain S-box-containing protein
LNAQLRDAAARLTANVRRDPTIRSRVISLIAILLIPLFIAMAWIAGQLADARRHAIEIERGSLAEKLAEMLDQRISGIEGMLNGLASSQDLSNGDFPRFERHSKAIARQPDIRLLQVVAPSGEIVSSTEYADHAVISATERTELLNKVLRGETIVSNLHNGSAGNPDTFSVIVPVFKNGAVIYGLMAEILPETFDSIFARAGLPAHWISAVVDGTGRFVARSLHPEDTIGKLSRPAFVAAASGTAQTGQFESVTREGVAVRTSFEKSPLTGWTSAVAVSETELQRPFHQILTLLIVGGGLISLMSLGLALLLAARIYEPVRQLRDETVALMAGRTFPEGHLHIAELNEVRNAFSQAIAKSAHLAAIVASSNDAILSTDLLGRVQSWNQGAEKLFGYSAKEMIGRAEAIIIPEARANEIGTSIDVVKSGKALRTETIRCTRDGRSIDVSIEIAPILDTNGKVIAVSSIIHDVSSRKQAEEHQRFLMRELTHRSKNLLAIVQSMARQTARSTGNIEEFEQQYMQRLQGLAASHDLLVNQNWIGVPLDELVRRQVTPFVEAHRANLAINGPEIMITAKAAQAVGLALHELSTNSMKYGALSTNKGKVSIAWEFLQEPGAHDRLTLRWEEHDGPPVEPPTRKGFGRFVLERMTTQALQADVRMEFKKDGLIWIVTAPLESLMSDPEFEGADVIG